MQRLNGMTFRQLRALQAVSETGTITQAAEILNLTPPAVHTQLKTLEENIGCAMFHRSGTGGFELTAEGRVLLQAQVQSSEILSAAMREIEAIKRGLAGSVTLGVVSTGKYFAPSLVADLKRSHPNIDIHLNIGNRDQTIASLRNNALDLVIMGRPASAPATHEIVLGDHPHVIILPPGHILADRDNITPEEIVSHPIIRRETGSGTRILTTRYLDRIAPGIPYTSMDVDSNETIKQAVIAGLGIALISAHTVTEELKSGRLVILRRPDLPIMRKWYLLTPKNKEPTGATSAVVDFITKQNGAYLPKISN